MKRVAILISGGGSNMVKLVDSMTGDHPARPVLVLSNDPGAGGLERAARRGVATAVVDHRPFKGDRTAFEAALTAKLEEARPDIICLAGFMRILTPAFTDRWSGKMLNIHPSLLPRYRGLDTHAWDFSGIVIERLRAASPLANLHPAVRDVVQQPPEPGSFDVIVVSRFLDRSLAPALMAALRPGGLLYYQTYTRAIAAGDKEAGCTVHEVTADLDDGPILGQARVPILPDDTPESLAARVLAMEHVLYPAVLRRFAVSDRTPVYLPTSSERPNNARHS